MEATRHLISAASLEKCKPGVRILNCARGGLVDEAALLNAIGTGRVVGAALDVYEQEPPPKDHPLLRRREVICTPHLAASTLEAQERVARQIAQDVLEVLMDRPAQRAVNMPNGGSVALRGRPPVSAAGREGGCVAGSVEPGQSPSNRYRVSRRNVEICNVTHDGCGPEGGHYQSDG